MKTSRSRRAVMRLSSLRETSGTICGVGTGAREGGGGGGGRDSEVRPLYLPLPRAAQVFPLLPHAARELSNCVRLDSG